MKRKICTFFLLLALIAAAAVPVSAAGCPSWLLRGGCTTVSRVCFGSGTCAPCPAACPSQPATPSEPEQPSEPDVPSTPEQPSEPEQPSVPDTGSSVSAYEQEVVRLVNAERAKYGLSALTRREDLCSYARVKSQDMHDNGYFSHTSPTYGSPFAMMKSFGVTYSHAGENIAMGYSTPGAVVSAWMNSERHRANILSASYTQLGVGYVADGGYWTQWFVG